MLMLGIRSSAAVRNKQELINYDSARNHVSSEFALRPLMHAITHINTTEQTDILP